MSFVIARYSPCIETVETSLVPALGCDDPPSTSDSPGSSNSFLDVQTEGSEQANGNCKPFSTSLRHKVITVMLLCGCISLAVLLIIEKNKTDKGSDYGNIPSDAARQESTISVDEDAASGLDLRLNAGTSRCIPPYCKSCSTSVSIEVVNNDVHCDPPSGSVKNGTCYLCRNACKSFQQMINVTERQQCEPPVIKCCDLAYMGKLTEHCQGGMVHRCIQHHDRTPTCSCPLGKTGHRCEDDVRILIKCKCYKMPNKFCDDAIPLCRNVTFNDTSTRCQMQTTHGERCKCDKTVEADAGVVSCHVPQADSLTNGARSISISVSRVLTVALAITLGWNFLLRGNT